MSEYFRQGKLSWRRVKVELNLFDYATKADLKNATTVNTSIFAEKIELTFLKANVDKLDISKLKSVLI